MSLARGVSILMCPSVAEEHRTEIPACETGYSPMTLQRKPIVMKNPLKRAMRPSPP